jgi:peptidyl-prolyl cis-trans isomerase B (cyclophilin B)
MVTESRACYKRDIARPACKDSQNLYYYALAYGKRSIHMKQLLGIFLVLTVGMLPTLAVSRDDNSPNKGAGMITVIMETSKGNITLELDSENAPETVANFVKYAKSGHYDGTIFHRVIPGFMIQGGGMDVDMRQKSTSAPIKNEADNGLKNLNGTIAMARTSDPNSATAQFFINVKDNGFLDHTSPTPQGWGYAVFGKVTDGMDTVTSIEHVDTSSSDVPTTPVVINRVTVVE